METTTNFPLVFLLVLAMFMVQATASGHINSCDQLKESKLFAYFYEDFSGRPNSTAFPVVGFPGKLWKYDQFGSLYVFDDILREGPEMTSPKIGRFQGTFIAVSMDGKNLLLSGSLLFTNAAYNGSTIQIVGVVNQFNYIGEYGVTSATGKFRYGTGYATMESLMLDLSANYGLFRVNVTIRHY